MDIPQNLKDLQQCIDNQYQESLHLEYKESRSLSTTKEISKDVSAFANSDGGLIIYGIREQDHLPIAIDEGIDQSNFSKERLEDIITSNIAPKIEELIISRIPLPEKNSAFAIKIPKSYRGPHQDRHTNKYYRRFNFKSEPMEDYEIKDIRNRMATTPALLNVDIEIKHGALIYFVVKNIGSHLAQNVLFSFSPELPWPNNAQTPSALRNGIENFPPGRTIKFWYHTFQEVFAENSIIPNKFEITVKYNHCLIDQVMTDQFQIDLKEYMHAAVVENDLYELGVKLTESSNKLTTKLEKLTKVAEKIQTLAGPTGLNISITTLRNLQRLILKQDGFEKLNPRDCSQKVFQEVLGIDYKLAYSLYNYFTYESEKKDLSELEGMDQEFLSKFQAHFFIEDS